MTLNSHRLALFAFLITVVWASPAWAGPWVISPVWPGPNVGYHWAKTLDVEGDGDDDLVMAATGFPGTVRVWKNDWPNWTLYFESAQVYRWEDIAIGSVNADALPDIAVAGMFTPDDATWVYANTGSGFMEFANFPKAEGLTFANINNSPPDDLVLANFINPQVQVFADTNPGAPMAGYDLIFPDGAYDVVATNFYLSPLDDIHVATRSTMGMVTLENTGAGFNQTEHSVQEDNFGIARGEFGDAGVGDVLFSARENVFRLDYNTSYSPVASLPDTINRLAAGDFDNTPPNDWVALHSATEIWIEENVGGTTQLTLPENYRDVTVGDFDIDGDTDILIVGVNNTFWIRNEAIPAPPEMCDGLDNDFDGVVDAPAVGLPPCMAGEACHWGQCYATCTTSMDCAAPLPTCYTDDGRCDDAMDPCVSITCPSGDVCYQGSCFPSCTSDAMCDPANEQCYQSNTCRDNTDPCADVQCPAEQFCQDGGCFYACMDDADCDMYSPGDFCFDGRCAATACEGIDCPIDKVCHGGTCFPKCSDDSECDPMSELCYDAERCATSACDGVECGTTQVCVGGSCFEDCSMMSCSDPADACYDDDSCRDPDAPCDGIECGTNEVCHGGTCFTTCTTDMECDPMSICFDNRCTDPDDPWCDDFQCPTGEACYRADCHPECVDDSDCAMDETCYDGACLKSDCSETSCESGETCLMGVGACFTGCTMDSDCDTGAGEACYGGVCAQNMCEAYDTAGIDAYHDNHPFTLAGRRLNLTQYSKPWLWPRPIDGPAATKFEDWAPTATVDPFGLRSVRIVMFLDDEKADGSNSEGKYVLWLTQGRTDGAQGAGEGTFNIRFTDYKDKPDVIYNPNDEAVYQKEDNGVVNIQTTLTNTAGTQTSIGIGHLTSSEQNWEMQIFASLGGDLDYLEVYNAETGNTYFLDPTEPVVINNPEFPDPMDPSEKIYPESGTPCSRDGGVGICEQGSQYVCRNGKMLCDQTVFPWGFEVCDGKDNTCSGAVDDDPIYYPIVYGRQSALSGWNWIPTLDQTSTVSSYMNYTPRGADDRQGSTAIQDATGSPLQAADKVWTLAHRDLTTGLISVPIVHGVLVGDSATANSIGEQDRNMRLWSPLGHNFDEFFVAWYDDRYEGGNQDDKIPDDFDLPTSLLNRGDFRIKQKLAKFNTGSDKLESDAAVVRPVWLEGQTARDTRFNMRYEGDGDLDDYDDLDDDPYEWYLHLPRITDVELERLRSARVKVEGRTGDEALCVSNTATGGCYISTYTCNAGQPECQAGDPSFCSGGACVDSDGDGFGGFDPSLCPMGEDCNDGDPDIKPGAFELCNGIDDDCDGRIDLASNPGNMYGNCPDGDESCGPWTDNPMAAECNGAPVCVCPDGPEDPSDPPSEPCLCREGLSD